MPNAFLILLCLSAVVIMLAGTGFVIARGLMPQGGSRTQPAPAQWVCPMHPDVHQGRPGRCPICGMALEKASAADEKSAHQEAHGVRATATNPSRPSVAL